MPQSSLPARLVSKAHLWLLARNEMTSKRLRDTYRQRFAVDVGLYSYGCFSEHRVRGPVRIGRYCSFARTARIVDADHPTGFSSSHPYFYDPAFGVVGQSRVHSRLLVVEDDVWLGHNAVVLPGCAHIGRGAIIGAGAIVTHDVPAYTIVAGVPARKIRDRFGAAEVRAIEASAWWTHEPRQAASILSDLAASASEAAPANARPDIGRPLT